MTTRQTLMREPSSVLGRMFDIDSPFQPAAKLEEWNYKLLIDLAERICLPLIELQRGERESLTHQF